MYDKFMANNIIIEFFREPPSPPLPKNYKISSASIRRQPPVRCTHTKIQQQLLSDTTHTHAWPNAYHTGHLSDQWNSFLNLKYTSWMINNNITNFLCLSYFIK